MLALSDSCRFIANHLKYLDNQVISSILPQTTHIPIFPHELSNKQQTNASQEIPKTRHSYALHVPRHDPPRRHNQHNIRMPALQPLLASVTRPRLTMPRRIRPTPHLLNAQHSHRHNTNSLPTTNAVPSPPLHEAQTLTISIPLPALNMHRLHTLPRHINLPTLIIPTISNTHSIIRHADQNNNSQRTGSDDIPPRQRLEETEIQIFARNNTVLWRTTDEECGVDEEMG